MTDTAHRHAIEEALDDAIAFDHEMFLKATFAGHDGEARYYAAPVDPDGRPPACARCGRTGRPT